MNEPMELSIEDLEVQLGALFDDNGFHYVHREMSAFNIFEAVGSVRAELRHSNFLAYLLSPSRPHGLRTRPLVLFLRTILARLPLNQRPVMPLEIIAGDLDDAIVYRERENIDILIELPSLKLAVAIENKVDSQASDGQLDRYSEYLKQAFPSHRRLLVFLTPSGIEPNHDLYVAYSYVDLASILEDLSENKIDFVPEETRIVIRHYVDMVRRHIVQNDRLRALAIALYERHKEAFDYIFECRPEPQSLLTGLRETILGVEGLIEDSRGANVLRFLPKIWDESLKSVKGDSTKWTKTGRLILFEIKTYPNSPGRVNLSLILGPGESDTRIRVYNEAVAKPQTFSGLVKPMGVQWATIFSRDLLTSVQAKGLTFEAQAFNVGLGWSEFQANSLPKLIEAVLAIDECLANSV